MRMNHNQLKKLIRVGNLSTGHHFCWEYFTMMPFISETDLLTYEALKS